MNHDALIFIVNHHGQPSQSSILHRYGLTLGEANREAKENPGQSQGDRCDLLWGHQHYEGWLIQQVEHMYKTEHIHRKNWLFIAVEYRGILESIKYNQ